MTYSKLQYISQGNTLVEQENNIKNALENGADWIQVRWKNATDAERLALAKKTMLLCRSFDAVCIINDSIAIAKEVNAHGVHLGLEDASIQQARSVLGKDKIIGGTANTLDHVLQRMDEGCDYIGLGPFRFTTTKEKLSPILGGPGYQKIIDTLKSEYKNIPPIYAIGGITFSDLDCLSTTGIYGIALSEVITQNPTLITKIKNHLNDYIKNS